MKTKLRIFSLVALVIALLVPTVARAQVGSVCGGETMINPDGRLTDSTIPAGATFYFFFWTTAGRSYSLEFKTKEAPYFQPPGVVSVYTDFCVTPITVRDTKSIDPRDDYHTRRVSFTATTSFVRVKLVNSTANPLNYTFSGSETTMFGPAWSTISNYNTYYSFSNTTNSSITGTLTLTTTTGASGGTSTFTIAAGRAAFTNTVALATLRGVTGNATFTHDGPPGAILVESDVADFSITPPYIQPVKFQAVREIR